MKNPKRIFLKWTTPPDHRAKPVRQTHRLSFPTFRWRVHMTHVQPRMRGWQPRNPTPLQSARTQPKQSADTVLRAIACVRAEIAILESDWTAEAERAAARSLGRTYALGDRETWDRTTWNRYLAAAQNCEHRYLPQLRQLYADVEALQNGTAISRAAQFATGSLRRVA